MPSRTPNQWGDSDAEHEAMCATGVGAQGRRRGALRQRDRSETRCENYSAVQILAVVRVDT